MRICEECGLEFDETAKKIVTIPGGVLTIVWDYCTCFSCSNESQLAVELEEANEAKEFVRKACKRTEE